MSPLPEMQMVASEAIEAVGYDGTSQVLYVRFLATGETYAYSGVADWVFEEFMRADSLGQYFNSRIRSTYAFDKV